METNKLVEQVKGGEISPLKAYIELKRLEKATEIALAEVKDLAYAEASNWGEKSFKAFGAQIEVKNAASRWDYSGVPLVKSASERLKYLEKLAQIGGVDEETGEVVSKANKIEGKATLSISLK